MNQNHSTDARRMAAREAARQVLAQVSNDDAGRPSMRRGEERAESGHKN